MFGRGPPQRGALAWPGRLMLLTALGLTGVGLSSIYAGEAADSFAEAALTRRQAVYAALGVLLALLVSRVNLQSIGLWSYAMFGGLIVLLALLVVARYVPMSPIFPIKKGAVRWIQLGPLQAQPSEYAKLAVVLALAWYLRYRSNYRTIPGLIPPFLLTMIPAALILKEPDLGTSLLFPPVLLIMLFAAGARRLHLLIVLASAAVAAPAFYFSPLMADYQRQRIEVLVRQNDPDPRWQMGEGFQLRQSRIAIGSGGWSGQAREDTAFFRHNLLPEDHNDFIFAVVGHQGGFVGAAAMVLAYLLMVTAGFTAASATDDPFARLVGVGLAAMIGVQAMINMSMTIGIAPITGVTLPFVSHGGSSLVANFLAVGLMMGVSRRQPARIARKPFEFDRPTP